MHDHLHYLMEAVEEARLAREDGNTPFGALLTDREGTILLRQRNVEITERDCCGHAEAALMRVASKKFDSDVLRTCTLYSICEPCAMCAGAIYWGNVGRVVYGISEKRLQELTGEDARNLTLDLPCREVFARGRKKIEVIGPVEDIADAVCEVHKGYWNRNASIHKSARSLSP